MNEVTDFLSPPADRPVGGRIVWATTIDNVHLRLALWPLDDAKGTVLLLNGRTEYIEKYGCDARALADAGFASASLDWRGQGLSERDPASPAFGHVTRFSDYQIDLATLIRKARAAGLPAPYFMLAHSLGGSIGLRALLGQHDFAAAAFSAPMWGITNSIFDVVAGWGVATLATATGFQHRPMPTTGPDFYVISVPFEGNTLTGDRVEWDNLVKTLKANPALELGRPTCGWIFRALKECHSLQRSPLPKVPSLIVVGDHERVVSPDAIHSLAAKWPDAELIVCPNARHEILLELPKTRKPVQDKIIAHFLAHADKTT